jgi:iron complex outermembrane receptor protein
MEHRHMARSHPFHHVIAIVATIALPAVGLAQTGTVSGRVVGAGGEPLQGASVVATGTARGGTVRGDGSYSFSLPAGRHEVRARLLGYVAVAESVTVVAGSTATANFTLQKAATSLEAVAVLSTRGQERTVISAPVPIDVLSTADIQLTGRTETSQIIQAVAPSFNFPRTTIGDGTDHIRPATLRGLAPD